MVSPRILQAHCQSRTRPSTDQSFVGSACKANAKKIELKKISSPSENKEYPTAQPETITTMKRSVDNGLLTRGKKASL